MVSPADAVAKQVAVTMESWTSIEITTRQDFKNLKPTKPIIYDNLLETYIETAAGQRFCDARYRWRDSIVTRLEHFCDGKRCADVTFKPTDAESQRSIVIKRFYSNEENTDRMDRPMPIGLLHVGRRPLYEAVATAEYCGAENVLGRECHAFVFPKVRLMVSQDLVYYIDSKSGWPLKVEAFRDSSARAKNDLNWVWKAETLDDVEHHAIPLRSSLNEFGGGMLAYTRSFLVESVEFDKSVPDSRFWPTPQPGVPVIDAIAQKTYEVPGLKLSTGEKKSEVGSTTHPIYATKPIGWTVRLATVTLGIGIAILAASVLVWWRRRWRA